MSLGILGAAAACTVNSTTNNDATPDGGTVTTPDGGTVATQDSSTCSKAPPSGGSLSLIAAQPAGSNNAYGQETTLALDQNGYPMVAFSTNGDAGQVFFMRWDACQGAWTAPAVVDNVGGGAQGGSVNENNPLRQVAIASDSKSGAIAIVYVKQIPDGANPSAATWIAKSTDHGATWTKEQLSIHPSDEAGDIHDTSAPNVTFDGNSKLWVAYQQSYVWCDGSMKDPGNQLRCEGWVLSGDSGNWSRQVFQRGADGGLGAGFIAMETDSAGNVGIASITSPDTGYNRVVSFWRPSAGGAPVQVFTSQNVQNDSPVVSLAFYGTKPRIAAQMADDDADNYNALYSQSDDGVTWSAVTKVPKDVTRGTVWYQSLVSDSKGQLSLLAYDNGGNDQTPTCGDPQVMRSTDGTTWTPFCVLPTMVDGVEGGSYVAAKIGADDKLQLVFYNDSASNQTNPGAGVVYWHE